MELPQEYFGAPSSRYSSFLLPIYQPIKRKVFISHYHGHQWETDKFLRDFGDVFIHRSVGTLGGQSFINSNNTDYVMQCIRRDYVGDATVTIVLVGSCTHGRRYVDWEIKGSLQRGEEDLPNGLLGIEMPSSGQYFNPPPRLELNWQRDVADCYARCYRYPNNKEELRQWIEDAFRARTSRDKWIKNPHETMFGYDRTCSVCKIIH